MSLLNIGTFDSAYSIFFFSVTFGEANPRHRPHIHNKAVRASRMPGRPRMKQASRGVGIPLELISVVV